MRESCCQAQMSSVLFGHLLLHLRDYRKGLCTIQSCRMCICCRTNPMFQSGPALRLDPTDHLDLEPFVPWHLLLYLPDYRTSCFCTIQTVGRTCICFREAPFFLVA